MTIIDRRAMLKCLLGGTVVATTGLALVPDQANSVPLPLVTSDVVMPVSPVEKSVFVSGRRRPRSRRRTVCSYHHGKKVCSTHS
jgi:hypothetical protein